MHRAAAPGIRSRRIPKCLRQASRADGQVIHRVPLHRVGSASAVAERPGLLYRVPSPQPP